MHERNLHVDDVSHGINLIRRRLYRKKVFLVLDDVDQLKQLKSLAWEREWFGSGSRIIITTRNKHLLSHLTENIYDVNGLTFHESLRLFHLNAFKNSQPTNDLLELSRQVVNYTNGLPLAIVVLGSHLCGRSGVEETEAIEGIMVDVTHSRDMREQGIMGLHGKSFSAMTNLRLLSISNVHLSENVEYLSSELRFFEWNGYLLKFLPLCFHLENLFELIMCNSCIEYLSEGMKSFLKLKTINLSHSCNLITTPDFTGVPNLETLDLEGCTKLHEVHPSVAVLTKLTVFVLKNCRNLLSFPSDIHGLKSLKILNLCGCLKLDKLPQNIGVAKCLEELDMSRTAIRQVPSSIVQLKKLEKLSLHGCNGQRPQTWFTFFLSLLLPNKNPDSMCSLLPPLSGLITLKILDLSDCNLLHGAIPNDIGSLCSLEELNLSGNNFDTLPPSINQLMKLEILWLERCKKLQSLPELPPQIVVLGAQDCTSLERLSPPEQSTSRGIELYFYNCFKLVENYGSDLTVIVEDWCCAGSKICCKLKLFCCCGWTCMVVF
ncbi:disease resistance-like protein DSC1 [Pistacia vera]|uniref:disease resistance-like protein DSC1 n=1 Tax=Pistacia vera TaxID=55513 RepID=UPI001263C5BF|nr:disease resistance-like protein DSC1 [Pistacia vera]